MDTKKQPGISFDGIILVKENLWRDNVIDDDYEVKIDFNVSHQTNTSDPNKRINQMDVTLNLINDNKIVLKFEFTYVGFFSVIQEKENMDIEDYIQRNASALMIPYIREHISTITQKTGVKPVLLAPININPMFDAQGEAVELTKD